MKRPLINKFNHIVWPLGIAETLAWAATFYTFPALLLTWEQSFEWSKSELSGAYTAALVATAVTAPFVGRQIDKGRGQWVLTAGTAVSAGLLLLLSIVTDLWHFYAIWIGLGVAMAGILYDPCFTFITRHLTQTRRKAITMITLMAGFAGTVSFWSNYQLTNLIGWRGGVRVLALVLLVLVLPLFWYGAQSAQRFGDGTPTLQHEQAPSPRRLLHQPLFWLLVVAFVAMALQHSILLTHLLPLLDERGVGQETAVLAASLIGPMQVAGRLVMMRIERHIASLHIFMLCFVAMAAASLFLFGAAALPFLLAPFVILQGAGNGVTSILRPLVTAELLGEENFGVITGMISIPFMGAVALAPTLAALIWEAGGYNTVILVACGVALVGLLTLLGASRMAENRRYPL